VPYHEAVSRTAEEPDFDPGEVAVFIPDEAFEQYSYGSEHITHDQAIGSLLNLIDGLERAERALGSSRQVGLRWAGERLGELWKMRGPFPGLGAALHAFGIDHANLFAYRVANQLGENEDPWPLVDDLVNNPVKIGPEWTRRIGSTTAQKYNGLAEERRALLRLLARFDITNEQAVRFFVAEERRGAGITLSDRELIANPYLLYEADRVLPEPIPVRTIDRGVYPTPAISDLHPVPEPSAMKEALDIRRVRAHVVSALERRADQGDTLASRDDLVLDVRKASLDPPCPVDGDLLAVLTTDLEPVLQQVPLGEGDSGFQLDRLSAAGDRIRVEVTRRANAKKRHEVSANWSVELDRLLGPSAANDADEQRAREEKVAALEELAAARVAVLIGPAGTGKTTLLAALCSHRDVHNSGVLLLAPTGKARVQLEKGFARSGDSPRARTIAEFLVKSGRYDPSTGMYRRSEQPRIAEFGTVIIDEASMLTEEQLDAVLDGVSNVRRLVLVGDPRQLPPIGAGRPFVDIVQFLAGTAPEQFPRVGPSYTELTVRRRQAGIERDDLALAEWFGGESPSPLADEVWSKVLAGRSSNTLRFERWDSPNDVFPLLTRVLTEEIDEISSESDEDGFGRSLGGVAGRQGGVFFNNAYKGSKGAGESAERWQVLSPVRGGAPGVTELNRSVQRAFRPKAIEFARLNSWGARTPRPMGPEGIVYGDKVINVLNHRRKHVWPEVIDELEALKYVANGEIGMVVGNFKRETKGPRPKNLEVEFGTQPGFKYKFWPGDVPEEGGGKLELAYAVTIHKSQGSEFGITFLVLPNPCRLLSRELLYTALTRQTEKVVVLHQGPLAELLAYSSVGNSETARRLTNLFTKPTPKEVQGRYLEDRLIHRTADGNLVRSKSEVIIADALASNGIIYAYEAPFVGYDGTQRLPDFTIDDPATGDRFVWEHLGMLGSPAYRRSWERKLEWYERSGVVPHEAGGGTAGTLIVTADDPLGGIDSASIHSLIATVIS
ncbi:MAG TPA: AAA family ATPase, partial [Acidimicrobiia bacterium]|nr:AAA family ATPase [Acidimicrobiia bacterium]